jgi:hypothetical protein
MASGIMSGQEETRLAAREQPGRTGKKPNAIT